MAALAEAEAGEVRVASRARHAAHGLCDGGAEALAQPQILLRIGVVGVEDTAREGGGVHGHPRQPLFAGSGRASGGSRTEACTCRTRCGRAGAAAAPMFAGFTDTSIHSLTYRTVQWICIHTIQEDERSEISVSRSAIDHTTDRSGVHLPLYWFVAMSR